MDNVHVEVEGSEDVLLWTEGVAVLPSDHQLGVVHDVQGEDETSYRSVDQPEGPVGGEEDGDDAEYHET